MQNTNRNSKGKGQLVDAFEARKETTKHALKARLLCCVARDNN